MTDRWYASDVSVDISREHVKTGFRLCQQKPDTTCVTEGLRDDPETTDRQETMGAESVG